MLKIDRLGISEALHASNLHVILLKCKMFSFFFNGESIGSQGNMDTEPAVHNWTKFAAKHNMLRKKQICM